ncbi:MAG TPA: glycoside hydrolase family 9 protein [Bacteroidales bacterium]|nr:glycoside hydrolase family 9 protein [Bacteroidales bacterium]
MTRLLTFAMALVYSMVSMAQEESRSIIVDQFGYLPSSKKIAVIKNPHIGFDSVYSFVPGKTCSLVNADNGKVIFTGEVTTWNNGAVDASSGDQVWHFDFSAVEEPGTYYVLDKDNNRRSFLFEISNDVYNEVLRQAMRTFFYQRSGFKKEAKYAGKGWADGASHLGPLQDKNCRSFFDKDNPATERDVSGGWYDAGDYNKYTSWTANYVVELMKSYLENPGAWSDDYNIPESGNGVPDILDETKWGINHLLRMQETDGSVLSIVGESHASPPSAANGPGYYGPVNTSATLNTAGALAISSKVYRSIGQTEYANKLLEAALKAWKWAEANPGVLFNNNDPTYNSRGLGAGRMEVSDYGRQMAKLEAACYLFEVTGDEQFRDFFDQHYREARLIKQHNASPFESIDQETLLYYTTLENGTKQIQDEIRKIYRQTIQEGELNLPAQETLKDPYLAYIKDYTWGSNAVKSAKGNMFYDVIYFNLDPTLNSECLDAALNYIHYINGVNPLNMVYLSNMYNYGGDNCANEFYHSWFCNGSKKWDRVGVSTYGPPPGYLTGGANPHYNWDRCCPKECDTDENNARCFSESINPPKGQPAQKSYKDFNTSWPLNSWEITENSLSYQTRFIRLLSKFVSKE